MLPAASELVVSPASTNYLPSIIAARDIYGLPDVVAVTAI
jgi:hypothetical protein